MLWLNDAGSVGIEVQRTLDGYLELSELRKICTVMWRFRVNNLTNWKYRPTCRKYYLWLTAWLLHISTGLDYLPSLKIHQLYHSESLYKASTVSSFLPQSHCIQFTMSSRSHVAVTQSYCFFLKWKPTNQSHVTLLLTDSEVSSISDSLFTHISIWFLFFLNLCQYSHGLNSKSHGTELKVIICRWIWSASSQKHWNCWRRSLSPKYAFKNWNTPVKVTLLDCRMKLTICDENECCVMFALIFLCANV